MRAAKVLELERRLQEPAFLAGAASAAELVAKMVERGEYTPKNNARASIEDAIAGAIRGHFGLTSEEEK